MATYVTQEMLILHREGLLKLINDGLEKIPQTWKRLTSNVIDSKQAYEQIQTHGGLGLFQNMSEVGGVTYDAAIPRFTATFYPVVRTLGVKWSKQSKQKDLYGFVKSMGPQLADAAAATMNLIVCNAINLAFGGGVVSPDGQPVFSSAHPLVNGTQSNLGTQALSGPALEDAIQQVLAQVGDRGIPKYFRNAFKLFYGPLVSGVARRAARSDGLQGTSDNDTNDFVKDMVSDLVMDQMIGFGQATMQHTWGLLPNDETNNPLTYIQVQGIQTQSDTNIDFGEVKMVCDFEGVPAWLGWRGTFGVNL